jgi:hypothetical protein
VSPYRNVITPAELEIRYDDMGSAMVAAMRRDPSVAARWRSADLPGRIEIVREALECRHHHLLRGEPRSGLCCVCRAPTGAEDVVLVVGDLVVVACADCVTRARDLGRRN